MLLWQLRVVMNGGKSRREIRMTGMLRGDADMSEMK